MLTWYLILFPQYTVRLAKSFVWNQKCHPYKDSSLRDQGIHVEQWYHWFLQMLLLTIMSFVTSKSYCRRRFLLHRAMLKCRWWCWSSLFLTLAAVTVLVYSISNLLDCIEYLKTRPTVVIHLDNEKFHVKIIIESIFFRMFSNKLSTTTNT